MPGVCETVPGFPSRGSHAALGNRVLRGVIMAKIKLTKSAVDAAQPQDKAIELRDTVVPGFLCKITPAGRKVFMLQYRTNAGERRKPALGQYGEQIGRASCRERVCQYV